MKPQVLEIINRIPVGRVAYYGQVSDVLAMEFEIYVRAQVVGWVLSGMKAAEYDLCPWQRVVSKTGFVSTLKLGPKGMLQLELIQREGIEIVDDVVDMKRFGIATEDLLSK